MQPETLDTAMQYVGRVYIEFGKFLQTFPGAQYQNAGIAIEGMGVAMDSVATGYGAEFDLAEIQQDLANNILAGMAIGAGLPRVLSAFGLAARVVPLWTAFAAASPLLAVPAGIFVAAVGIA